MQSGPFSIWHVISLSLGSQAVDIKAFALQERGSIAAETRQISLKYPGFNIAEIPW